MHIGGVYAAMIDKDLAQHSGGTYLVRIEDTDQSREIAGAKEQFLRELAHFGAESPAACRAGESLRHCHDQ